MILLMICLVNTRVFTPASSSSNKKDNDTNDGNNTKGNDQPHPPQRLALVFVGIFSKSFTFQTL